MAYQKNIGSVLTHRGNIRLFFVIYETGGNNFYRLSKKADITYSYTFRLLKLFTEAGIIERVKRERGTRNGCQARNREVCMTEKGRKIYDDLKDLSQLLER